MLTLLYQHPGKANIIVVQTSQDWYEVDYSWFHKQPYNGPRLGLLDQLDNLDSLLARQSRQIPDAA